MEEICETAFPELYTKSFTTIRENRGHGLTCRTWTLKLTKHLQEDVNLQRSKPPTWLDDEINRRSAALVESCADGDLEISDV